MQTAGSLEILDTTLREGEQCFGVFFPRETKKRIATLLDELGVDFIEAGHPAAAPSIRQTAAEIARLNLRTRLVGHARPFREEIRLVKDVGLPWVGLFSGISEWSLRRYGLSKESVYDRAGEAVLFAKGIGLKVKFTCEDASRTDVHDVVDFFTHLHALGADRLSYADTLGALTTEGTRKILAAIKNRMAPDRLHFHFHDDFGRAFGNAMAAAEGGARCVDASILGIGERMGLVALEDALILRSGHAAKRPAPARLDEAVELVRSCINQGRYKERRFAHKSGIHINGTIKDPRNYEPVAPDGTSPERILVLSKLVGRSGLRAILSRHGFQCAEEELGPLLREIKSEELLELAGPEEITRYFLNKGLERRIESRSE